MKVKTLVVLLIILAVLAVIGVATLNRKGPEQGKKVLGTFLMKDLPANDIAALDIRGKGGEAVHLRKVAGRWVVQERFGYPADFSRLSDLVHKLMNAKVGRTFQASQDALKRLQLLDPEQGNAKDEEKGTRVTFQDSKGKTLAQLVMGKVMKGGQGGMYPEGQYLKLNDRPNIFLVDKAFEGLEKSPSGWLKKDLIDVKAADVREISCVAADGKNVVYAFKRPEEGKDLEPVTLPPGRKLRKSGLNELAGALSSLNIEDVADPGLDLQSMGLNPSAKLEYRLFNGIVYDLYPGKKCKGSDKCYLRVEVGYEKPADVTQAPKGKIQKKKEDPAQEAKSLTQKIGHWTYIIPQWKHDAFVTDLGSLLEKESKKKP
jgi:hypothetical protein